MARSLPYLLTLWFMLAVFPHAASPLSFRVIEDDGFGNRVLLIYDCGKIKEDRDCSPEAKKFSRGDPARLRRYWSGHLFDEVWLISGGGLLTAGIEIGNQLRSQRMAVRVPNATRLLKAGLVPTRAPACVSSCTVAFMGGQFRSIDRTPGDEAAYQVHAASSVQWDPIEDEDLIHEVVREVRDRGLAALASKLTTHHREIARDLFILFQEALWLPIRNERTPIERRERDRILNQWARDGLTSGYSYDRAHRARDQEILELEGMAALQDILMRIERDSMDCAIEDIRRMSPRLGRRSDDALAMLSAMYETSSILETNRIPAETLLKMGYVTEFVK